MKGVTSVNKEILALQRAMPITRLLDCGMDYADVNELFIRTTEGEAWDVVAEELARSHFKRSEAAMQAGNRITAFEEQSFGIAALMFAQMAFNFDVERKRDLYREISQEGRRLCELSEYPLERIEVPFAEKRMVGWLLRPRTGPVKGTVVLFGGQSGWGLTYFSTAKELARRGLATLLAEGPGQGETRISYGLYLDVDVTAAYRAFVDHVAANSHLGRIGIWGNSVGGLWAAKVAAHDKRIAACCVNGSFAAPKVLSFRTAFEQSAAMLACDKPESIQSNFNSMAFSQREERIDCPLLVLHGGADPLVSLSDQQPFLDAATSNKYLKVWDDGEHTIYNHSHERTSLATDWFASQLS